MELRCAKPRGYQRLVFHYCEEGDVWGEARGEAEERGSDCRLKGLGCKAKWP